MNDDEMVCRKRKHVFLFVDCAVYKGDRCVCGEERSEVTIIGDETAIAVDAPEGVPVSVRYRAKPKVL